MDKRGEPSSAGARPLASVARMRAIVGHLAAGKSPAHALQASQQAGVTLATPRPIPARSDDTRWNGWGFRDTRMFVNADRVIEVSGHRYPDMFPPTDGASQQRLLPLLLPWAERTIGLSPSRRSPASVQTADELKVVHESPYANVDDGSLDAFLAAVKAKGMRASTDMEERVRHGHGQTCEDVFRLRHRREIDRVPDAVVWPQSHADVEALVALVVAQSDRICLFPFGGGTK
jgi:alkyldihydroxyacetonephosphate synthase